METRKIGNCDKTESWKYRIEPVNGRCELKLREIWQYRGLILLFVKRDFISKYKQTILGPLWAVINPVLSTLVFHIVFGNLAKLTVLDSAGSESIVVPGFLFYMSGNVLWNYFSGTVKDVSHTFIRNAGIMGKVYYPRLVSPIASALSGLIKLSIQLALFIVIFILCILKGTAVVHPSLKLLLLPLLLLQLMAFGMGAGLVISAVTTKYRDMAMLVDFGLQLWMYATPVVYGLQLVPEKWIPLFMLNPLTPIVTTARYLCFGEGYFKMRYFLQGWLISLIIFLTGLLLFARTEKNFVDTI